ncbi:hypothetical protein EWM64_g90 [Hericium alpestre]|uniref:MBOAT-domain-containing protein n=1 Tax=Hericium alpestre TaxID=135208 RepID=A0A4Z0AC78_9AGAM|nr:hypothetical protein EWM64_g90 [Hericium alpestre]
MAIRTQSALLALLAAFFTLKFIYTRSARGSASATTKKTYLLPFYTIFSVLMLLVLHGTSILKVLVILSINYAIAKAGGGSKWVVAATWIFNGGILFLNETYSGYTFAGLHSALSILDSLEGVYPRWHVSFNITMLRLVSFNMDYHWACNRAGAADSGNELTERQRKTTYHALDVYSYRNYLAYTLYAPLYIAGPIMTFNDFVWQASAVYEIHILINLAAHTVVLLAARKADAVKHDEQWWRGADTHAWGGDSAGQLSMIGFWNLVIVWLKLLLPWRFFRLWALLDGIDPPENMVRCVANNYSTLGFWRSWHRSYNLWLVRYIYIPLGGTKRVALSTVLIFSFVALWHDLSFRLLAWGWLVSFFILPELLAKYLLPASKFGDKPWYRHVCALGAVCNVLMMMAANLVGFVLGTEGMGYMVREMGGSWAGLGFMVAACACLFVGVQVMFEYREEEMRRGIYRRC